MAIRDYSTIHNIKKFVMEQIAPNYFNVDETNDLNVGLLGYTTDLVGTLTEDAFNTVNVYLNEMFPHLAIMPETIYNNATLFKIDKAFGTAAEVLIYLFIPEEQILANGKHNGNDGYEFILDSDMIIDIENMHFMMDYSVKIQYAVRDYLTNYVYTAEYLMEENGGSFKNSISTVESPYILKIKRIYFENMNYIQLVVKAHQVDKFVSADNVINSDTINLPTYTIEFDNYLANFEVFYKAPNDKNYTQLNKLLSGSPPEKNPFCYYKIIDEGVLEISFSSRDNYFYPEYNSDIIINYYTTLGPEGNFDSYKGTDIVVTPSSSVYNYNNNLVVFGIPMGSSSNGEKPMSTEELKQLTVSMFSTVGSYSNENDLQLYFDRFNNKFNSDVLFIKSRDDIFERLFSSFIKFKDSTNEIFHTNTLNLELSDKDISSMDNDNDQTNDIIIKPGDLFTYKDKSSDTAMMIPGNINDYIANPENYNQYDFLYSNPFLIYYMKNPTTIAYYINSVNKVHFVDYIRADLNSMVHFICNDITVSRNSITGKNKDKYHMSVRITPTSELQVPMVIRETDDDGNITDSITNSIYVELSIINKDGTKSCYYIMGLTSYDLENGIYTFGCDIRTNDKIDYSNRFTITNALSMDWTPSNIKNAYLNDDYEQHPISMTDVIIEINIKYDNSKIFTDDGLINESRIDETLAEIKQRFDNIDRINNTYSTKSNPITFIEPFEMINSTVTYESKHDGVISPDTGIELGSTYNTIFKSFPLLRASTMLDSDHLAEFINTIKTQYEYLLNITDKITNNFSIDVKFYNTYGKSNNFYVDDYNDDGDKMNLNKVNITIGFKVHPVFGTDELEFVDDLKLFIKEYIEGVNNSGTNSIYISNLIKSLENNFNSIDYLIFTGINDYTTSVQSIENTTVDLTTLKKQERIAYVPEYLTVSMNDINIEII